MNRTSFKSQLTTPQLTPQLMWLVIALSAQLTGCGIPAETTQDSTPENPQTLPPSLGTSVDTSEAVASPPQIEPSMPETADTAPRGNTVVARDSVSPPPSIPTVPVLPFDLTTRTLPLLNQQTSQMKAFSINSQQTISIPALEIRGTPVYSLYFEDTLGQNIAVFTQTGKIPQSVAVCDGTEGCNSAQLYAYHFTWKNGELTLLRKIQDRVENCPFDLYLGFIERSLSITDLNDDGIAEMSFAYKLTCRSDVSPSDMKFMMLENGAKFAIRGTMTFPANKFSAKDLKQGEKEWGWGQYKLDSAFAHGPNAFRKFAIAQWNQHKSNDLFLQF